MDADAHRQLRELLGSYSVGALDADDAARVRRHLTTCPECRALLDQFAPVATALRRVDPALVAGTGSEAETPSVEPLLARVGRERRRRSRRRAVAAAGSLAAVAAAVGLWLALWPAADDGVIPAPAGEERVLQSLRDGVSGSVTLLDRFWGTQLSLSAQGLPARERVSVWLERPDGSRIPAGTVNGLGDEMLKADLSAGLRVRDAVAVGVSEVGGPDLLSASIEP